MAYFGSLTNFRVEKEEEKATEKTIKTHRESQTICMKLRFFSREKKSINLSTVK